MICLGAEKEHGMTIIEVLVAMVILGVVTAFYASSLALNTSYITDSEHKSEALLAAQEVLDDLRLVRTSTMPTTLTSSSSQNVTIGGTTYGVVVTYCAITTYCPPTASDGSRHILVTVTLAGKEIYAIETVFTEFN